MSLRQNVDLVNKQEIRLSYQSECHCAKTVLSSLKKLDGLVTSQNVTAPKRDFYWLRQPIRLVTSQNVTAPKPLSQNLPCKETSIPTWLEIISEQSSRSTTCLFSLILSWIDVSVSIRRICIPRKMAWFNHSTYCSWVKNFFRFTKTTAPLKETSEIKFRNSIWLSKNDLPVFSALNCQSKCNVWWW